MSSPSFQVLRCIRCWHSTSMILERLDGRVERYLPIRPTGFRYASWAPVQPLLHSPCRGLRWMGGAEGRAACSADNQDRFETTWPDSRYQALPHPCPALKQGGVLFCAAVCYTAQMLTDQQILDILIREGRVLDIHAAPVVVSR